MKMAEEQKNTNKKTAIIVGVFFIVATAAPMLTSIFIGFLGGGITGQQPIPGYLVQVSAVKNQVLIGMFVEMIWAVSVIGIPVMLFPILKKHNEDLALGFFGLRSIEAISVIIGSIGLLLLLTLSQEFVKAGAPEASHYLTFGTLLLATRKWSFMIGCGIFWSLSPLILNYVLYKSKLVPRWLSVWGFAGAILSLIVYVLQFFGSNQFDLLFLPIAIQEMVFAVWLIVKGFNPSATGSGAAKQGEK
jgi:hypothetical protein